MEEKEAIIADWEDDYLGDKPTNNSKYFSDTVPEGQLSFKTTFKFLTKGTKIVNNYKREVITLQIQHEGKEKTLEIGTTQYEVLNEMAKHKPVTGKEVEWERTGIGQKDTRRKIKFK
jgi:hypothetical protein